MISCTACVSAKGPFASQIIRAFAEDTWVVSGLCLMFGYLYISLSTGTVLASDVSDQNVRAFTLVPLQDFFGDESCFSDPYKFYDFFISTKMPLKF